MFGFLGGQDTRWRHAISGGGVVTSSDLNIAARPLSNRSDTWILSFRFWLRRLFFRVFFAAVLIFWFALWGFAVLLGIFYDCPSQIHYLRRYFNGRRLNTLASPEASSYS